MNLVALTSFLSLLVEAVPYSFITDLSDDTYPIRDTEASDIKKNNLDKDKQRNDIFYPSK